MSPLPDRPIRASQYAVVFTVLVALMLDGLASQLLALVATLIIREWGSKSSLFGPVLAASVAGMALGAALGGWLGDRFGRKPILVFSTLLFGVTTLLAGLSNTILSLGILRLLSGLGFGAALPAGYVLATEWLPHRARPRAISLLVISNPLGGILGASAVLALLPILGWRGCFVACGLLAVALALFMMFWLPESPSFLIHRGRNAQVARLLRRIAGVDDGRPMTFERPGEGSRAAAGSIFVPELMRLNIGAGLTLFTMSFVSYGLQSCVPIVLTNAGLQISTAITALLVANIFAIGGGLATGVIIPMIGSKRLLLLTTSGTALAIAMVGLLTGSIALWLLFLLFGLVGLGTGMSMSTLYSVLTFGYPGDCRSTGVGLGSTMGRCGGIVSILASGRVLALLDTRSTAFYAMLVVAAMITFCATWIIDRHITKAQLDN